TLELQAMSDEDLRGQLEQSVAAYDKMKFDHSVNGIEQPLRLRESRRDIARMQTELRRRELATMTPEELAKRDRIQHRRRKSKKQ
ncbi:MAG: 50S ribosomal protein L29, partial [Bacteroidota bacterium]